jgi:hypothetical protein
MRSLDAASLTDVSPSWTLYRRWIINTATVLELDAVLLLGVGDTKAWFIPDSPQGARDKQVQDQDTSVKDASSKDTSSKGRIIRELSFSDTSVGDTNYHGTQFLSQYNASPLPPLLNRTGTYRQRDSLSKGRIVQGLHRP